MRSKTKKERKYKNIWLRDLIVALQMKVVWILMEHDVYILEDGKSSSVKLISDFDWFFLSSAEHGHAPSGNQWARKRGEIFSVTYQNSRSKERKQSEYFGYSCQFRIQRSGNSYSKTRKVSTNRTTSRYFESYLRWPKLLLKCWET